MSDIITSLNLDKDTFTHVVVVKELNGCSSSFITSCILSHTIKHKKPVLIISMHHSKDHYQNIGLKMNYNLSKNVESGLIRFHSGGEDFVKATLECNSISLKVFVNQIRSHIRQLHQEFGSGNVIFDGVSHLFDIGYSLKEVNYVCKDMIDLIREFDNSFVVFQCNAACESDETHVLANLLAYKANVLVEVNHLASGWSTDVSGHITFKYPARKFESEHITKLDQKPSHHLFKLFDRGVKLLAPGAI